MYVLCVCACVSVCDEYSTAIVFTLYEYIVRALDLVWDTSKPGDKK